MLILKEEEAQELNQHCQNTMCFPNLRYGWTTGSPSGVVQRTGWFSVAIICIHELRHINMNSMNKENGRAAKGKAEDEMKG